MFRSASSLLLLAGVTTARAPWFGRGRDRVLRGFGGLSALSDVGEGARLDRGLGNAGSHQPLTELLARWGSSKPARAGTSRLAASV